LNYRHNSRHAEFNVLRDIKDGSKGVLYIYRELFDHTLAMARPCDKCMILLKEKNIKKIVYTTTNGFAKEKLFW